MGSDVYPVLGRTRRIEGVPRIATEGSPRGVMHTPMMTPECYEFFRPDGDHRDSGVFPAYIHMCYALQSWLGGHHGNLVQLESADVLRQYTEKFVTWLSAGQPTYSDLEDQDDELGFRARYIDGYYGAWLYPLTDIRDFDYDRIALITDGFYEALDPTTGKMVERAVTKPHPEFKTYRQLFQASGWFEFLDVAIAQDWDFLIVVFD